MADEPQTQTPSEQLSFDEGHPMYMQLINGHTIRLIELEPGAPFKRISIRISIHELEHAPEFEAVSYVWGDARDRTNIFCNGKMLSITKSLTNAFQRVRYTDRPRILWADAICINQGDAREKSHHVAFMNKVYGRAENVLICMGDDAEGVAANVSALIKEHNDRMSNYKDITEMPILPTNDPVLDDQRWKSLAVLMENSWFSRAWVVQEAGVARNPIVLFGKTEFSYRQLLILNRWVVRCASELQTRASLSLLTIHSDWEQWSDDWATRQSYPHTVVDFLSHAKGLGCQEPRDHVYAFLGHPLLQKVDGGGPVIDPKYTIPLGMVYQRLTQWILSNAGLSVFSAIEHDETTINSDIPSWVVRWDMDIVQSSFGYYVPYYYRACGPESAQSSMGAASVCNVSGGHCRVFARSVDMVLHVFQFSSSESDWVLEQAALALKSGERLRQNLLSAFRHAMDAGIHGKYEADHTFDAFSLTLCSGLRNYERAEEDLTLHRADRISFFTHLHQAAKASGEVLEALEQALISESQDATSSGSADRYFYDISLACKGRCFFVTESGYFGVGPYIMKRGDKCVLIKGARVPFVLRNAEAEDIGKPRSYKVLGESYVHGIMNGELVEGQDGKEWQSIVLV
jgi:hypothetical protein